VSCFASVKAGIQ